VVRTEYSFLSHEELLQVVEGMENKTNMEKELAQRLQMLLDMLEEHDGNP
jgi:hypothetical protein